jgi:hypothetical protein
MTNKVWTALQETAPEEVLRRTGIITEFVGIAPTVVDGAIRNA